MGHFQKALQGLLQFVTVNIYSSVVRLTLLYITYQAVIPAKAGIQFRNPGFRVKPGMTIKVKGFLTHYTSILLEGVKGGI